MDKILTVFTPAYNRAHTIGRTYESLCRQTCKDFKWLVIDDGSTDNTEELVKQWMTVDNGFEIKYVWKENGGLHTGYNKAIEVADTELLVCIDSDDFMPDKAVELIVNTWHEKGNSELAGIIGLDFNLGNQPLNGFFPNIPVAHRYDLSFRYNHHEDVKMVMRTDLLRKVAPQPSYNGEKNFNPSYMQIKIDLEHEWLILNQCLCIVEYQQDGMANGIFKQYLNSPNSFAAQRLNNLAIPVTPLSYRIKQYIHLDASCFLSGNFAWMAKAPRPWFAGVLIPLGYLVSLYIKHRASK